MIYETDMFRITYMENDIKEKAIDALITKSLRLALLFEISHLPLERKISINIMDKNIFKQQKSFYLGKSASPEVVAFSTERIHVVSYRALCDRYTCEEYHKVILHEVVHVVQQLATKVPPEKNVWLYEAVACYLAGQRTEIPQRGVPLPWDVVKQDFYAVPRCYSIAYHLGKSLLSGCLSGGIVALCSDVSRCDKICAEAYASLFK